jgi:hypothetical protein
LKYKFEEDFKSLEQDFIALRSDYESKSRDIKDIEVEKVKFDE